jgi:hypothetical protein
VWGLRNPVWGLGHPTPFGGWGTPFGGWGTPFGGWGTPFGATSDVFCEAPLTFRLSGYSPTSIFTVLRWGSSFLGMMISSTPRLHRALIASALMRSGIATRRAKLP